MDDSTKTTLVLSYRPSSLHLCSPYKNLTMGGELIILEDDKLRLLAKLIYYQEVEAIKSIQFRSEPERVKYLWDCRSNYEGVLKLLDDGAKTYEMHRQDETKSPIAHDVFEYVKKCVNSALQTVRNYTLRVDYLKKISDHSASLISALQELDPTNVTNVQLLAKEANTYKNCMVEYLKKHQSGLSSRFSEAVKQEGLKFDALVKRYQAKLGYEGQFKNLKDEEKLLVYEKIIEDSGRGAILRDVVIGGVGVAVLIFAAGTMVWDIFSSDHKIETGVRDAVSIAAAIGGAALGDLIRVAVSTQLLETGAEVSTVYVAMLGFVTGIVAAFILGAAAGILCDLIFGTGGDGPISTEGFHCYVAPMPDGATLARQLAHDHPEVLALMSATDACGLEF